MTSLVSRVACMRLLGCDADAGLRGARAIRYTLRAARTGEPNHAPPASHNPCPRGTRPQIIQLSSPSEERPNAAHHAPAGPFAFDDKQRVAGRVHALVRLRHL